MPTTCCRLILGVVVVMWVGCASQRQKPAPVSEIELDLRRLLAAPVSLIPLDASRHRSSHAAMERFYASRRFQPAWIGARGALRQADDLLRALKAGETHGLSGNLYRLDELRQEVATSRSVAFGEQRLARLDLSLTEAFMVFADHIRRGLIDPHQVNEHWHVPNRPGDLAGLLTTSLALQDLVKALERLSPHRQSYDELRQFLDTPNQTLRVHVETNLERWRWLPRDLGDDYLLIRVAAFELDWVSGGVHESSRRVIVGEPFRRTPSFASQITDIVIHPSWHVPRSIARDELLPLARAEVGFLMQRGFRVQRGERIVAMDEIDWRDPSQTDGLTFIQAPGGTNPLGKVKFNLPNPFAIFLHDTPAPLLFGGMNRDLSHGCVRVDQAVDLARSILSRGTQVKRFESLLSSEKTGRVALKVPLPVYFIYWTMDVVDGQLRHLDDIYGEDDPLVKAWRRAVAIPHTCSWIRSATSPLRSTPFGGT